MRGPVCSSPEGLLSFVAVISGVRSKALGRHVAELERLSSDLTLVDIVDSTRIEVDARLWAARTEVDLNVWRSITR